MTGPAVGWTTNSIGYHSDDGLILQESPNYEPLKCKRKTSYSVGDIVGVGASPDIFTVIFTLNGEQISRQICPWLDEPNIFPSISLIHGHKEKSVRDECQFQLRNKTKAP